MFRIRINQISDGLSFRQIHLPIPEGPQGKFSSFSNPHGESRNHRPDDGCRNRPPTMQMELDNILARKACRTWKPDSKTSIETDRRLIPRGKPDQRRHPRLQNAPCQPLENDAGIGSTNANNRNAGSSCSGRERNNGPLTSQRHPSNDATAKKRFNKSKSNPTMYSFSRKTRH
jgi:hypothetical protein